MFLLVFPWLSRVYILYFKGKMQELVFLAFLFNFLFNTLYLD